MPPSDMQEFDLQAALTALNTEILERTNHRFDLGNFIRINTFRGGEGISMKTNVLAEAQYAIDDNTRKRLEEIIKTLPATTDPSVAESLRALLVRKILYIGSECERLGSINVVQEYNDLDKALESQFMVLEKIDTPTYGNLLDAWGKIEPSVLFFSCHGDKLGFYLQNDLGECQHYNTTTFLDFFRRRVKKTECVVLSACESLEPGKKIAGYAPNVICINKKVNINTARVFNFRFMKYLNDYSNDLSTVYEDAFNHANEFVKGEALPDSFSFEFIKSDLIF